MALRISGQGAVSPSLQATLCGFFFPKGLCIDWESRSNWGGIGASRGFHSRNDGWRGFFCWTSAPSWSGGKGLCEINPGALMSSSFNVLVSSTQGM